MDQMDNSPGAVRDDNTDESTSIVEFRWSSDEEEVKTQQSPSSHKAINSQETFVCIPLLTSCQIFFFFFVMFPSRLLEL